MSAAREARERLGLAAVSPDALRVTASEFMGYSPEQVTLDGDTVVCTDEDGHAAPATVPDFLAAAAGFARAAEE